MVYSQPPRPLRLLVGTVLALTASTAMALGAWSSKEPQLRYQSVSAPQLQLAAVAATPVAPESTLAERPARVKAPSLASVAAPHTANVQTRLAPPSPTADSESPAAAEAAPAAPTNSPAPSAAPSASGGDGARETPAPAGQAPTSTEEKETAAIDPARLVEASRPSFPRTFNKPELVSYPGMPESEQPGPEWQPEGNLWRLEVRVLLDETGTPVKASVADNDLSSDGMVRRYERLALRAVKDWRYEPARIAGEPVASELLMAFHFDTRIGRLHDIGDPPYQVNKPINYSRIYSKKN